MGGHPYWYFVPYQKDPYATLDELREREFAAGRYNPVMPFIDFEPDKLLSQNPGAQHGSIDEAVEAADADGTRSILDIDGYSEEPEFGCAAPVPPELLHEEYGTDKPTRAQVDEAMDALLEHCERGQAFYLVVYDKDRPSEMLYLGYSFD